MSIEWVNRAIDDLRAWGRAHAVAIDVDEIRLLCDYASDYLGVETLGDFTSGTFEELLLSIYPRKVIAPPESAGETLAAARTLVDFLQSSGEVAGKEAARMRATLDRIEPEMPEALADTSRFGMAKSIFSAIGPESLEHPDQIGPLGPGADLVRPAAPKPAASGTVPHAGTGSAGTPGPEPCDCPKCSPLPAVRLAPRERLAAAARQVPLLHDAHRLVEWMLASGRTPTAKGRFRAADVPAAVSELGVAEPALLWDLAVYTGVAEARDGAVAVDDGFGPLDERDEDDVLDLWASAVEYMVDKDTEGRVTGEPLLDEELYDLCDMLYRVQAPVSLDVVAGYLEETGVGESAPDLALAAVRLGYCGLVEHVRGDMITLTPLAVWGLRELYSDLGIEAPEAPDLADASAGELIEGLLSGVPAELAEDDITRWLERRPAGAAAAELLGAAAGAPAVARGIAVTIVDRLGAEAEPAVRACLDDPELRPHAIHWLSARGLPCPQLTQEELLWVSVDMLALAMPAAEDDPESFAENMAASGPPAHLIEEMWRVDHPDVVEVLELLGRSMTDGNVAKAARKAAFKARSRSIG
ncbi:hypothetical protein HNP84_001381 [Thermocatellispora tengchongensis]|uniref:Uncharacterized protein n=1 Tax=Thermocatellispora tengchongensis TaxID=1073253 RepID=A0A840NVW3_9ACTN|nr:hypothetical protein [Thermocatellispora tengchongensis]MBB5131668.1 hypothetical protein [Thermocatellispora tengchongensis]